MILVLSVDHFFPEYLGPMLFADAQHSPSDAKATHTCNATYRMAKVGAGDQREASIPYHVDLPTGSPSVLTHS